MDYKLAMAAILAGVLLGIGFLLPILWPLALVGIVPLLLALKRCRTVGVAAFCGWLASFVLALFSLASILWGTLPLDWYGFSAVWIQWLMVGVSWMLASAVFALGGGIFGALAHIYRKDSWSDLFIIPAAWTISEWLGSFIFSTIGYGPGSLVGAHFTLPYVGYLLVNDSALLQLAWLGDVYALSFAAIAVGVVTYRLLFSSSPKERRLLYALACVVIFIWALAHPLVNYLSGNARAAAETSSSALSVVAISRYAPPLFLPTPQEERDRFEALRTLIAPLHDIDVLVFPENAVFLRSIPQSESAAVWRELRDIGRDGKLPLSIDSQDIRQESGELFSRLEYAGSDEGTVYSYKQFLLPLGEYVPYVYRAGLQLFGGRGLLERVVNVRAYARGPSAATASVNGITLAARFCDEVMSPELYRQQVVHGANMLVNLSSQSWFHGSHLVYEQMKAIARVRAVSLGRWYVQSGNMAPAFVLDQYGQVVGETRWDDMSTLQVRVPALGTTTPARAAGVLVLLVPLTLLFLFAYGNSTRRSRSSQ